MAGSEPNPIGYGTDDPAKAWNAGLDAADSPDALRAFVGGWPTLAPDAIEAAAGMTEADWPEWRKGLESERRRKFAGEAWAERWAVITMPGRMLRASMVADQFFVPWGLAWLHLVETELLSGESR